MNYSVLLLDWRGRLLAGDAFAAPNDHAASDIALALHSACSEAYAYCELWREHECICSSSHARMQNWTNVVEALRQERQDQLLVLEATLLTSYECLRSSDLLVTHTAL